jgi:hypothetical protein
VSVTAKDYAEIYRRFQAPISQRHDCGKKCAPRNGGVPVCCDIEQTIPIVDRPEWQLLKKRSRMWRRFRPVTPSQKREVADLANSESCAVQCRGAAFCERDNRSLACRSFPYFPYVDRAGALVGLAHYWAFEGQCWVIANPDIVERAFVEEMLAAHELLFDRDAAWQRTYRAFSATMRRVYSRRGKRFLVLHRDGGRSWVLPGTAGRMVPAAAAEIGTLKTLFPDRAAA